MNFLQKLMYERHGIDQFSVALFIVSAIISFLGRLFRFPLLSLVGFAVLVYVLFRFLSKNTEQRSKENQWFLGVWYRILDFFGGAKSKSQAHQYQAQQKREASRQRKQAAQRAKEENKNFKTFSCPSCSQKLRVPRGKGKIRITCAKCGEKFEAKS